MCPNCTRGLTIKKEVCSVCAGTGFWNPQSLPVNEFPMDENIEGTTADQEVSTPVETSPETVAPVEGAPAVETSAADAGEVASA